MYMTRRRHPDHLDVFSLSYNEILYKSVKLINFCSGKKGQMPFDPSNKNNTLHMYGFVYLDPQYCKLITWMDTSLDICPVNCVTLQLSCFQMFVMMSFILPPLQPLSGEVRSAGSAN